MERNQRNEAQNASKQLWLQDIEANEPKNGEFMQAVQLRNGYFCC